MVKKIIKLLGLKKVLNSLTLMIEEIIHKSIKDPKLRAVVMTLFYIILDIVRVMTNDDKSNDKEVKDVIMKAIPQLLEILTAYKNNS